MDRIPFFSDDRWRLAVAHKSHFFIGYCDRHGEVDHWVKTQQCVECLKLDPSLSRPMARKLGLKFFPGYCDEHKWCDHHIQSAKCAACFTVNGARRRPRTDVNSARAWARREGHYEYIDECLKHGQVKHHVQTGKCLTCFNAMGYPRP